MPLFFQQNFNTVVTNRNFAAIANGEYIWTTLWLAIDITYKPI